MVADNSISEWHEQVEFSEIYFKEHIRCREAERLNNSIGRCYAVKSKISVGMGVLKDEEKINATQLKKQVQSSLSNYEKSLSFEERGGSTPLDPLSQMLKNKLDLTLDDAESKMDTMINKKMPFLNIRKEIDIRGM